MSPSRKRGTTDNIARAPPSKRAAKKRKLAKEQAKQAEIPSNEVQPSASSDDESSTQKSSPVTKGDESNEPSIESERSTEDKAESDSDDEDKAESDSDDEDKAESDSDDEDKAESDSDDEDKAESDSDDEDKAESDSDDEDKAEAGSWAPFKKKKEVNPRLQGTWNEDEIKFAINELSTQLKEHDEQMELKIAGKEFDESKIFSTPGKRKKRDRLRKLERALEDGTPVGGQLIPKKKGKKERYAERSRLRQEERKGRVSQAVMGDKEPTVCYNCGEAGHELRHCPTKNTNAPAGICYNCGKRGHNLKDCPDRRSSKDPLKFVRCYICKEHGHLSSECSQGTGKYPKGGECHSCGSKYHLMRDCPERLAQQERQEAQLNRFNSGNPRGGRGGGRGGFSDDRGRSSRGRGGRGGSSRGRGGPSRGRGGRSD